MKYKTLLILRLFFLYILINYCYQPNLTAQNRPVRAEIQVKDSDGDFQLIPSKELGVLVFHKSHIKLEKNLANWHFSFYNSNLQETWQRKIPLETNWELFKTENKDSLNYIYFTYKSSFPNQTPFLILKINIVSNTYKTFYGSLPLKASIYEFKVNEDFLIVGGINTPSNAQFCFQSLYSLSFIPRFTGSSLIKIFPFIDWYSFKNQKDSIVYFKQGEKKSFLDNIYIANDKQNIYAVINDFFNKKTNQLRIEQLNKQNNSKKNFIIKGEKKKKMLVSAKIFKTAENNHIAIGTYDNSGNNYPTPSSDVYRKEASGVFFAKLNNDNDLTEIKYYNFSEFKGLLQSFGSKDSIKLDIKTKKMKGKGKELSLNYQYLLHDIQHINNQLVFMLETYYPVYRTVYYTNFDYYGRPTTSSYTVFDGYKFIKALIMGFDNSGSLLWNHAFDIINIQSFTLKDRVRILPDDGNILLLYASDGKIASKIINQNEVIESINFTKVDTNDDSEKILSESENFVDYWYKNYFISYGYQKVKKIDTGEKVKRNLFYFNKLSFE